MYVYLGKDNGFRFKILGLNYFNEDCFIDWEVNKN